MSNKFGYEIYALQVSPFPCVNGISLKY